MKFLQLAFRILILILSLNSIAFSNSNKTNLNPYEANIKVRLATNNYNLALLSNKNILLIDLCDIKDKTYCPYLNRDMKMDGKKIIEGATIEPKIEGEWRFRDHNQGIQFTPKDPWRAEETYRITIDKSILPYFVTLDDNIISFKTSPLLSNISEMVYLQDPSDQDKKFVQTKIQFNYPIDPESFEGKYLFTSSITPNSFTTQVGYNEDKTGVNLVTKIKELKKMSKLSRLL
jgi:hypothetical protein